MPPAVFADRFVVVPSGEAVDLATGETVWLRRVSPAGRGPGRHLAGSLRRAVGVLASEHRSAGRLRRGRARRLLRGVGVPARRQTLEAARRGHRRRSGRRRGLPRRPARCRPGVRPGAPSSIWTVVLRCFRARKSGCRSSRNAGGDLRHRSRPGRAHAGARLLPSRSRTTSTVACVSRLTDVLDAGVSGRPRTVRLDIPRREPGRLLPWAFARAARLHGYIPVGSPHARARGRGSEPDRPLARRRPRSPRPGPAGRSGRSVESTDAALYFLELGLSSDRPHVLLQVNAGSRRPAGHRGAVVREPPAEYVSSTSVVPGGERAWPSGAVIARRGVSRPRGRDRRSGGRGPPCPGRTTAPRRAGFLRSTSRRRGGGRVGAGAGAAPAGARAARRGVPVHRAGP